MSAFQVETGAGSLAPVNFKTEVVETSDNIERNIRACLSRPYHPFTNVMANPYRPPCSIFGSGPSIDYTWPRATGDVIACNAAHDYLIKKGIVPRYAMLWDPVDVTEEFITPNPRVTYLLASRCHPKVFRRFRNHRVIVWHAAGDDCIQRLLEEYRKMEPMIMGGSAAAIRAMFLAVAMGYMNLNVFGMDGSFDGSSTHIRQSVVKEDEMAPIFCNGKWFRTASWLAVQAEDFKKCAPYLAAVGVKMTLHGNGLIPHIASGMGLPVIGEHGTTPERIEHAGI